MKSKTETPKIVLLHGERGAGKTTCIIELSRYWRIQHRPFFGIAEPKVFESGSEVGISALDLVTGRSMTLAVRDDEPGLRSGRWRFLEDGLTFADGCCRPDEKTEGIAVIDEIGPMELRGQGLKAAWDALHTGRYLRALVIVRSSLADKVGDAIAGEVRVLSLPDDIQKRTPEELDRLMSDFWA